MKRIGVIAVSGDSFVRPIAEHLATRYEVKRFNPEKDDLGAFVHTCDLLWCDWCDQIAAEATRQAACPVVIRCHSFEVFSDWPARIDWRKVRHLMFVAEHVRQVFHARFPTSPRVPESVVPNGFDAPEPPNRTWAPNVVALGGMGVKKGMTTLFTLFRAIHDRDPQYRFHIAGHVEDMRYIALANHERASGIPIEYHGHVNPANLRAFLSDKTFFVNSSPWEGDPVAVKDAVAAGCFPVVRTWPGASDLYPARWLWSTIDDALEIIEAHEQAIHFGEPEVEVVTNIGELTIRCSRTRQLQIIDRLVDGTLDRPYELRPWPPQPISVMGTRTWPRISLAMLTRNNEATIERALSSVRDVADEAVILDSGSTDRTIEIAQAWGCRVHRLPWCDDFSGHRNHLATLCRGQWIYVCDSDDFLLDPGNLREVMLKVPSDINAVAIRGDQYGPRGLLEQCREILAYRRGRCHYEYPIHNQLRGLTGVAMANAQSVSDYIESMDEKLKRTIPLLETFYAEHPENGHGPFFLARSHWSQRRTDETILWCEVLFSRHADHGGYASAWTWYVQATLVRDGVDAAAERLKTALHYHPDLADLRHLEMSIAMARWFNAGKDDKYAFTTQGSRKLLDLVPEVAKRLDMPFEFREERS